MCVPDIPDESFWNERQPKPIMPYVERFFLYLCLTLSIALNMYFALGFALQSIPVPNVAPAPVSPGYTFVSGEVRRLDVVDFDHLRLTLRPATGGEQVVETEADPSLTWDGVAVSPRDAVNRFNVRQHVVLGSATLINGSAVRVRFTVTPRPGAVGEVK